MTTSRGARYLLRNGLDYLSYQQYDRSLKFLREAETRKKELNDAEKLALNRESSAPSAAFARHPTLNLPTHLANARSIATVSARPRQRPRSPQAQLRSLSRLAGHG